MMRISRCREQQENRGVAIVRRLRLGWNEVRRELVKYAVDARLGGGGGGNAAAYAVNPTSLSLRGGIAVFTKTIRSPNSQPTRSISATPILNAPPSLAALPRDPAQHARSITPL